MNLDTAARTVRTRSTRLAALAVGAVLAVGVSASPAQAAPVPPNPSPAMIGTWVNTNSATRSVVKVVVAPNRAGSVNVDAFGACSPSACEWGAVPARVYGANVSSTVGGVFQSKQRFLSGSVEWSRRTLMGRVTRTTAGYRLALRELVVFSDASGRHNYVAVETFAKGVATRPTLVGHSVSAYRYGTAPLVNSGALGSWVNAAPSGGLAAVTISGSTAAPAVHAFGQCSPTNCDWGSVRGIAHGTSIASTVGDILLAPYAFGFENTQLVIVYNHTTSETLTVTSYTEFTDGSGRSNYVRAETLVRAK